MDLDCWLLLGIETEGKLIKAWSHCNNASLALFPKEVVWAGVESLDFPRYKVVG